YKTIRPDNNYMSEVHAVVQGGADAVLFFSPSAVHHLQDVLGHEKFLEFSRRSVFAAIGPVTEEELHKAKVDRVVLAQDTTVASVIAALRDHFSQPGPELSGGANPG
ncbi:MAG: uroporphyrinogen-III synthase, partial [Candidatus Acidiferrum sp.]